MTGVQKDPDEVRERAVQFSTAGADQRLRPGQLPVRQARGKLHSDFGRIWALEDDPAKRRRLLATLFDRVWEGGGTIVAVKPREAFLRYFQAADELARRREKKRVSKAGATGLEPALYERREGAG